MTATLPAQTKTLRSRSHTDSSSMLLHSLHSEIHTIIGTLAHEEASLLSDKSKLKSRTNVALLEWSDLSCDFDDGESILGRGSYCHVARGYLKQNRPGTRKQAYAIKCLQPKVKQQQKDFKGER